MSKKKLEKNKKVLIINGHPDPESFCAGITQAYFKKSQADGHQVQMIEIGKLNFSPNLALGYRHRTNLEPDLLLAIEQIKQADHLVWIFPNWWSSFPAIMKGFIDRCFLPGIMFNYLPGKVLPEPYLAGKTAHIIVTANTPAIARIVLGIGSQGAQIIKSGVMGFCGVKTKKVLFLTPIKGTSDVTRQGYLDKVAKLAGQI